MSSWGRTRSCARKNRHFTATPLHRYNNHYNNNNNNHCNNNNNNNNNYDNNHNNNNNNNNNNNHNNNHYNNHYNNNNNNHYNNNNNNHYNNHYNNNYDNNHDNNNNNNNHNNNNHNNNHNNNNNKGINNNIIIVMGVWTGLKWSGTLPLQLHLLPTTFSAIQFHCPMQLSVLAQCTACPPCHGLEEGYSVGGPIPPIGGLVGVSAALSAPEGACVAKGSGRPRRSPGRRRRAVRSRSTAGSPA